jgi:hypothetical protein
MEICRVDDWLAEPRRHVDRGGRGGRVPEFEVFDKNRIPGRHQPQVTILKQGVLSLNRAAFSVLYEPDAVELLYDATKHVIGLRLADPRLAHAMFVRRASPSPSGPFMVSAMAFLRHYEIDCHESRRWSGSLEDEVLCIALESESMLVSSNRAGSRLHN